VSKIAIVTQAKDFHAYLTCLILSSRRINCSIIEADRLIGVGGITWSPATEHHVGSIKDVDGRKIIIQDLELIWWRRLVGVPQFPDNVSQDAHEFIANNCRSTLVGLLTTEFSGKWVSHPEATRLAENKIVQLRAARRVGLKVPMTLVSQDPLVVREFCAALDYRVVVKVVSGDPSTPVLAGQISPEMLASDEAISLCPAIYQELIPGASHLRICCFGTDIHTALILSDRLDWRYPLDAEAQPFTLDNETANKLLTLLDELGLRMGIFDMKLDCEGQPIWLEVNPQGQFLFLEEMCKIPLAEAFADFIQKELTSEAKQLITRPEKF
jgi:glutathione synthase/RimK-type ligase-like ATP-grasp enzyme